MKVDVSISQDDLQSIAGVVQQKIEEAVAPLIRENARLRSQVRGSRRVVSHKEACVYFDHDVTPNTIMDYIHYRGLPAHKNGRKWFIEVRDLEAWQLGEIGFAERQEESRVYPPRRGKQRSEGLSQQAA